MLISFIGVGVLVISLFIVIKAATRVSRDSAPDDQAFQDLSEEPPVRIKGIGLNLGYYNPATNAAGDIRFTDNRYDFMPPFAEYASWIPAEQSATGQAYRNAQASFLVPQGTKVRALIDGVIVDVSKLYSNDYSVIVATSPDSRWRYETEHVSNPIVKQGDRVRAGQVVAEASMALGNSGWAGFEIGIGKGTADDSQPSHVCPFKYLDPAIEKETLNKIRALMAAWEKYRNDSSAYDDASAPIPGCLVVDAVKG